MRVPADVMIRQDEMRRAQQLRAEQTDAEVGGEEKTIADDCAAVLEAAWYRSQREGTAFDVEKIAHRMRELGLALKRGTHGR